MNKTTIGYDSRIKISRAQSFIKDNLNTPLSLSQIAKFSGISQFHFLRIFKAYLGETPFEFTRRKKMIIAFNLLQEDFSITHIAHEIGFDSSSSFNKFFKRKTHLTPSEFRKMEFDKKQALINSYNSSPSFQKTKLTPYLNENFEIATRKRREIYSLESNGADFCEIAPIIWDQFLNILSSEPQDLSHSEFLGLSYIDNQLCEDQEHIYKVALSSCASHPICYSELKKEVLDEATYAKFILKGSYQRIWPAFERAFNILSEHNIEIAETPCLENYINDPQITPEKDLITELLIPIKQ